VSVYLAAKNTGLAEAIVPTVRSLVETK